MVKEVLEGGLSWNAIDSVLSSIRTTVTVYVSWHTLCVRWMQHFQLQSFKAGGVTCVLGLAGTDCSALAKQSIRFAVHTPTFTLWLLPFPAHMDAIHDRGNQSSISILTVDVVHAQDAPPPCVMVNLCPPVSEHRTSFCGSQPFSIDHIAPDKVTCI